MKTMKRLFALALALVMCASALTGCGTSGGPDSSNSAGPGSSPGATDPQSVGSDKQWEDTLKIAMDGEPNSIFPNYRTNKACNRVDSCLYDTLIRWNDEEKVGEPALATGWEWVDDLHVAFTLRDDAVFTNGEKVTSEDVLYSLKASQSYTLATYSSFYDIENSTIEDDTHFTLCLREPYGNLAEVLGCTYYAVFSKKAFEDVGEDETVFCRAPIGSGPYKLAEWVEGEKIVLERNDAWWDTENAPYFKTLEFYFISEQSSRALALQSGDVDVAFNISVSQIAETEAAGFTVNKYLQNVSSPLSMNTKTYPVLRDEAVRKAIFLAMDKEALAIAKFGEYANFPKSSLTTMSSPYYYESEAGLEQDLETAKQLIADSGYSAEELTFLVYAPSGEDSSQIELFQAELLSIGITLNIEFVDRAVTIEHMLAGERPMWFGENDCWDISRMLNLVDGRLEASLDGYVGNDCEELYALIDAAKSAAEADRYDAYAAVQQWCTDHYVTSVIVDQLFTDAWNPGLTGMLYDAHCWPNVWNMRPVQ